MSSLPSNVTWIVLFDSLNTVILLFRGRPHSHMCTTYCQSPVVVIINTVVARVNTRQTSESCRRRYINVDVFGIQQREFVAVTTTTPKTRPSSCRQSPDRGIDFASRLSGCFFLYRTAAGHRHRRHYPRRCCCC